MRLATKAGRATVTAVRSPKPPTDTPVVACHHEWSGRSPDRELLTEVRSCPSNKARYLWKGAQAALILLLIFAVSCWWNEIPCPNTPRPRFFVNISMLISPIFMYLFVSEFMLLWLLRIFVLPGWILSPTFSVAFLNSYIIFRICSLEVANNITSSANRKFVRQSRSWSLK